jgi:hypothetical protein
MDEHAEVIGALRQAGVLVAIRWAYESAVRRALETYSPQDGHDMPWLGNTRYVLFRDRLDRVLRCDRYAVADCDGGDCDGGMDLDVLSAELSEQDLVTLPRVEPGTVVRHDLHGSPGWACRAGRFLIASGDFGFVRTLPWAYKSRTKRIVAMQKPPVADFEDVLFDLGELLGADLLGTQNPLGRGAADPRQIPDLPTFVVAHSLEPWSGQTELIFGRPRMNAAGGPAWYWFEDLGTIDLPATRQVSLAPSAPSAVPHNAVPHNAVPHNAVPQPVPDAPVRLRLV